MKDNGQQSRPESDHTRVASTAWTVAYLRLFTDIPLTTEVFHVLEDHIKQSGDQEEPWKAKKDRLAPQLEARYKLVDKLLKSSGMVQVLEVASGVAPRGLNFARSNSAMQYVEMDLPAVAKEKRLVVTDLRIEVPTNLKIVDGDALSEEDLLRASGELSTDQPIAVVNEGLLRYLNFDEKAQYAKHVHNLLSKSGGVWITPDISLREALSREDEVVSGHISSLAQTTGIDLSQNVFENEEHGRRFFSDLGFNIEKHSFLEVSDELVSPSRVGMTDDEVTRLNDLCIAFVMSTRSQWHRLT